MFKPSWAALLVASCCFTVHADESIEHISIYANRTPTKIEHVLASVTVLDRAAIVERQATDLPALLAQLPGVSIARDGGRGQNASVYVRGGNSGHTLVLIDGMRTGSATLGYKTLAMVPLDLIERIELIRGPRAAWYGADAVSGVIAITTRKAQQTEFNANVGSYGQVGADLSVSHQQGDLALSATAGYSRADGFNVRDNLDADKDGYQQRFAKLAAEYQTAFGLWQAQVDLNSGFYQFDTAWGTEDQADSVNRSYLLGWQQQAGTWQHQAQLSRVLDEDTPYGPVSRSPFITERDEFSYQATTSLSQQLTWLVGLNWYNESVAGSNVNYAVQNRINRAAFSGLSFRQDKLQLDGSVRRDLTEQYDANNTWQFAAGYWFTERWQLRASRGAAFKAPTFNDLFFPGFSNPELAPEKTLSDEIAIQYRVTNGSIALVWFENDVESLIQFDFATSKPQNIQQAKLSGLELVVTAEVAGIEQHFAYSRVETENTLTGLRLVRRPEHKLNWRAAYRWDKLAAFVTADYQSDTYQGAFASREFLGGFTLWGVGASYALSSELSFRAKVDNLFDKNYQTNAGFNNAGMNFGLSLSYRAF